MLRKTAIILVFSIFLLVDSVNSQPKFSFQLVGGYSHPLGDYSGTFGETIETWTFGGNPDSASYFMKSGSHYGIVGKFPINRKRLPLNITGTLLISTFGQNKQYPNDSLAGYWEADLKQTITSFGFGLEYSAAGKRTVFNPYLGLEFLVNIISGSLITYESISSSTFTYNMHTTVRGGISAHAGADYVLNNNIGVSLGAAYTIANLIVKNTDRDITPAYYLNDGEREDQGSHYPARTISYFQIFIGLSFYFGR